MSAAPHASTGALLGVIEGLASLGYTDRQIADGLEVPRHQVANFRRRYGIPAGQPRHGAVYRRPRREPQEAHA